MKLLIIRHGEPDYSIDSLTETGWKEAELLSRRISSLDVAAFYCSPLGRAKDTAAATLKVMGRDAEILPWLREFPPLVHRPDRANAVAWDWMPADWTPRDYFYDRNHWQDAPEFQEAHVAQTYQYVTNELDTLLATHGYRRDGVIYRAERPSCDTLVFFCHFGLECVLLSHLLNISPMQLWHGTCAAPTSVTTLISEERQKGIAYFRMSSFGDTSHLYAAGQPVSTAARYQEVFQTPYERT